MLGAIDSVGVNEIDGANVGLAEGTDVGTRVVGALDGDLLTGATVVGVNEGIEVVGALDGVSVGNKSLTPYKVVGAAVGFA